MNELLNISPIDGRYKNKTKDLENYFSEYALIKYRVYIEITWLKFLIKEKIVSEEISTSKEKSIDNIYKRFDINEANKVKEIESITKHDVKAIEYYLQEKFKELDILINKIDELSNEYKSIPMLGHTHGQIATPTTVGKEFKVFSYRLKSVLELLKSLKLRSKFSGAVGNYNCHVIAYPNVDWIKKTKKFKTKKQI